MAITVDEALKHATALVEDYSEQKRMMEDVDKMYFMEWSDKPTGRDYKFTTSPSARNALLGAIRLMTSTSPIFSVPYDKNKKEAKLLSEQIEKYCSTIWYHSGRFRGVPLEQPAIESLLRYGMMVLAINDTQVLKEELEKSGTSKAEEMQLQRLVDSTPYLIEAWDPKSVYPEWGRFGLKAVYRSVEMTLAEALEQFGKAAVSEKLSTKGSELNERVHYADYWDLEKHIAWITGTTTGGETIIAGEPIVDKEHLLPCIPIVVQTAEGSFLDADRKYQAIPFLYTLMKGELWERQNLELTVLYTNLFNIASNPTYKYTTLGEEDLEVDYSVAGGYVKLRPGEDYSPLQKDVMNKDMLTGLDIANSLVEESTLTKQALGSIGGLGANVAFSTVSLLNRAGRLPLVSAQKRGGWGIGTVMELIIEMLKDKGEVRKLKTLEEGVVEFDPSLVPDDLIIEAKLEVDLPQDQMNQANVAQLITQTGLASKRWAREKIMQIGQSDEMDKEIWDDQAMQQAFQLFVQNMQRQEMMRMQQAEQQMMAQGQGGQPQMPPEQMMGGQQTQPRGPVSPGSAAQAQAGLTPSQRPGTKPAPARGEGMPTQEGEM